jgi:hypothetical protein
MATANAKIQIPVLSGLTPAQVGLPANFDGTDNTQGLQWVYGSVSIDANPATYATGGIPIVSSKNIALPGWNQEPIKSSPVPPLTNPLPIFVWFTSVAGSGFIYLWNRSTNKLQIFTSNGAAPAALAEFTNAAAIPAGVSGDTIIFIAPFVRI